MDWKNYEFTRDDRTYVVKGKESVAWVERDGHTQSAPIVQDLCAEILRLAEESADQVAEREVARLRAQVAEQARTIDRLKMEARSRELSSAAKGLEAGLARMTPDAAAQEQINGLQHLLTRRERALDEVRLQLDAVSAKSRRRKAKIRKLRKELSVLGHQLEAARVLSAHAEREAVLAYLERWKIYGYVPAAEAARLIRSGAHLTAPASQPQAASPAGESAPE